MINNIFAREKFSNISKIFISRATKRERADRNCIKSLLLRNRDSSKNLKAGFSSRMYRQETVMFTRPGRHDFPLVNSKDNT